MQYRNKCRRGKSTGELQGSSYKHSRERKTVAGPHATIVCTCNTATGERKKTKKLHWAAPGGQKQQKVLLPANLTKKTRLECQKKDP